MNSDGLVVKTTPNAPYVLGTLNENGITKAFENITVFVGRAANGEGVGYFNGYINATKGGNIAGWTIKPTALHTSNNSLYLGTTGITAAIGGTNRSGLVFKAGDNFGVSSGGTLYANGAQIKGDIYANSLTLSDTIDIPESNIDSLGSYFKKDREFTVGTISDGQNSIGFRVSNTGLLTANNAVIYGTIYAKDGKFAGEIEAGSGSIGGWTIESDRLSGTGMISGGTISGTTISGGSININSGKFKVSKTGVLTATEAHFSGWEITDNDIMSTQNSSVYLSSAGVLQFKVEEQHELFVGAGLIHMWSSASIGMKSAGTVLLDGGNGVSIISSNGQPIKLRGDIEISNGALTVHGEPTNNSIIQLNSAFDENIWYLGFRNGLLVYAGRDLEKCQTETGQTEIHMLYKA